MARDVRRQLQAGQAFAASSVTSFDLPRDNVLKEINLLLEVAVSTGVAGALTNLWDRSPWSNIKRIELVADGKDTIKSYDGGTLYDINTWDFGFHPASELDDLPASDTGGSAADPLFHMLTLSLESHGMESPQNTFLDTRRLSSLELRITWGAGLADIYQTVTAPATLERYFLTPFGHEILDIGRDSTFSVNQEAMNSSAFPTTTGTDRQFRLNVGNAYRRIFFSSVDQNARAAVDRLERVILTENGLFNRRNLDAGLLKLLNVQKKTFRVGLNPGLAAAASMGENPAFLHAPVAAVDGKQTPGRLGFYCLDIAEDGRFSSLLDTRNYSDLSAVLSWGGSNTTDLLRITPTILIPNVR